MYELVDALDPRIALPCNDTRAGFAVRARTLRAVVAAVVRDALLVAVRDTTLRDATLRDALLDVVPRDALSVVPRDDATLPRAVVARDATLRDGADAVVADVVRETVLVAFRGVALLRDVAPVRADWAASGAGAMGSAKTARMDNSVEQTKNAPASKNTVPTAFLHTSAKLRLFINCSPVSGVAGKPAVLQR